MERGFAHATLASDAEGDERGVDELGVDGGARDSEAFRDLGHGEDRVEVRLVGWRWVTFWPLGDFSTVPDAVGCEFVSHTFS